MSNPHLTAPSRLEASAEVCAHHQVIRYRRSGTGPTVLLLGIDGDLRPLWPEVLGALTAHFRVLIPELPAVDTAAARLADFLEGLGAWRVTVIASGQFCSPALELALGDVDQIARVVLVLDGRPADPALDDTLTTRARETLVPLLVLRRGMTASEALALLTHFLAGGAPLTPTG